MNDILPTPPPGVFDDEPSGWTRPHTPGVASARTINPELRSSPRMASSAPTVITGPVSPAMSETLTQRKREMLKTMHGRRATARATGALRHDHIADTAIRAASQGLRYRPRRAPYRLRLTPHTNTCHRAANDTTHLEAAERCAQCAYQQNMCTHWI